MDRRLQLLLDRTSNLLREDLREVATAHDLKLVQVDTLRYLAMANRFSNTLTALVAYLGATKGSVSQTVKTLDRKGLVERVRDPDDGRIFHLQLTSRGSAIALEASPSPALRSISAPGVADALDTIVRALLAARGGVAFGVCSTCQFHQNQAGKRRCTLLDVLLDAEDAGNICVEHTLSTAAQ